MEGDPQGGGHHPKYGGEGGAVACARLTKSERKLPVENNQLIVRIGQFSDADCVTPRTSAGISVG